MFRIEFKTSNDAFVQGAEYEIAAILATVATQVKDGHRSGIIRDDNGANVGTFEYVPESE